MQITTSGLVLKDHKVDEESRLVTLLTKDRGIVCAYIRGAKRLRSSLIASTQLFCYSDFVLFKNKGRYSVNSADAITMFYELTAEIERFTLATYLAQLMAELAPEEEDGSEFLRLMLNTLHMLGKKSKDLLFIKAMFELRVLSMAGYMPDLVTCDKCGCIDEASAVFVPRQGIIVCEKCTGEYIGEVRFNLPPGILAAMRFIIYSTIDKVFSFTLSAEGLAYLNQITEAYLAMQVDKQFTALKMLHSLIQDI